MKVEISVPELVSIFKEIQEQPEQIYDMIRADIRETVGHLNFQWRLPHTKIYILSIL